MPDNKNLLLVYIVIFLISQIIFSNKSSNEIAISLLALVLIEIYLLKKGVKKRESNNKFMTKSIFFSLGKCSALQASMQQRKPSRRNQ